MAEAEASASQRGTRLDAALSERGLAKSRTSAARLIADGLVSVDGREVRKASLRVADHQVITLAASDGYVSRAAHKLDAALADFGVDPTGRVCLDVGASTGGFTQVLLERGAAHVLALDVGHDQLVDSIREDDRVTVIEGMNARYLTLELLSEASRGSSEPAFSSPTLVVADLSFISLTLVLPALVATAGLGVDYVVLIKPQFEVGRGGIREGLVHSSDLREEAVNQVLWAAWDLGLPTAGVMPSPILGSAGNQEYLAWFSTAHGTSPAEWTQRVSESARSR